MQIWMGLSTRMSTVTVSLNILVCSGNCDGIGLGYGHTDLCVGISLAFLPKLEVFSTWIKPVWR
jgi:hypothetical protein